MQCYLSRTFYLMVRNYSVSSCAKIQAEYDSLHSAAKNVWQTSPLLPVMWESNCRKSVLNAHKSAFSSELWCVCFLSNSILAIHFSEWMKSFLAAAKKSRHSKRHHLSLLSQIVCVIIDLRVGHLAQELTLQNSSGSSCGTLSRLILCHDSFS